MSVPRGPYVFTVALIGAVATSSIALYDAMHHGLTGRYSGFSDEYGQTAVMMAGSAVHGLSYAVFVWVLLAAAPEIDATSRVRRWLRRVLIAVFAMLAIIFLIGLPLEAQAGPLQSVFGAAAGISFVLMFLLACALGGALVRRVEQRPAAVLLLAIAPAIGLGFLLNALGSGFAHPGYAETAVHLGIALLALPLARRARKTVQSSAEPVPAR